MYRVSYRKRRPVYVDDVNVNINVNIVVLWTTATVPTRYRSRGRGRDWGWGWDRNRGVRHPSCRIIDRDDGRVADHERAPDLPHGACEVRVREPRPGKGEVRPQVRAVVRRRHRVLVLPGLAAAGAERLGEPLRRAVVRRLRPDVDRGLLEARRQPGLGQRRRAREPERVVQEVVLVYGRGRPDPVDCVELGYVGGCEEREGLCDEVVVGLLGFDCWVCEWDPFVCVGLSLLLLFRLGFSWLNDREKEERKKESRWVLRKLAQTNPNEKTLSAHGAA